MKSSTLSVLALAVSLPAPALSQAPPATAAPPSTADQPRSALAPADVPKDIAWGKGREVQAGLRLAWRYGHADQHTGLYVFAIYVRNLTKRTLTVSCPGFPGLSVPSDRVSYTTLVQTDRIFCAPRIVDASGKAVGVKCRLSDDQQRYALGPGQVAMVSHWMLRTLPSAARSKETEGYTQVAFVEPGKHRMTCELAASWPRRAMLRTGEVGFDVTAEDLGGRTESGEATSWGQPVDGVQAGLRVVGGRSRVHLGDRVSLELVLRNTTDHAIDITWGNAQNHYGWGVRRLGGSPQEAVWEVAPRVRCMLQEIHEPIVVAGALGLRIDARSECAVPMKGPELLVAGKAGPKDSATTLVCKPGDAVRLRALPITAWARGAEWLDRLQTGEITLQVAPS